MSDLQFPSVRLKTQTIGLDKLIGYLFDFSISRINSIHRLFDFQRPLVPFVVHHATVAKISEPGTAVGMNHNSIGRIERLTAELVYDYRELSIVLIPNHAAVPMLTGQLPTLPVKGFTIAVP
jgi:hypothetical protein